MATEDPGSPLDPDETYEPPAGMPRWARVFAIVLAVLVAIFLIVAMTGGPSAHGPRRHGLGQPPATRSAPTATVTLTHAAWVTAGAGARTGCGRGPASSP